MTIRNSSLWPSVTAVVAGNAIFAILHLNGLALPAFMAWAACNFYAAAYFGHAYNIAKTTPPCTPAKSSQN
jgi:hypothetical protein